MPAAAAGQASAGNPSTPQVASAGRVRPDGEVSRDLLRRVRVIAMVGASPDPFRPSFRIMRNLQRAGYRVVPVNPTHAGERLHGEVVVSTLDEAGPIDLVNVFRRSEALDEVVDAAIRTRAPAIWTQIGIWNEGATDRARSAGLQVVTGRCIIVEHGRLG